MIAATTAFVIFLVQYVYLAILLKVIHPFDAQAEGELSLSVDDYVVVRQVLS